MLRRCVASWDDESYAWLRAAFTVDGVGEPRGQPRLIDRRADLLLLGADLLPDPEAHGIAHVLGRGRYRRGRRSCKLFGRGGLAASPGSMRCPHPDHHSDHQ